MLGNLQYFTDKYAHNSVRFDGTDEGAAGGSGNAGGGSGGNSGQKNWEAEYNALKAKMDSEYVTKSSYAALQGKLQTAVEAGQSKDTQIGEISSKLANSETLVKSLTEKVGGLETTSQDTQNKLAEKELLLQRHSIIFKDFPELAAFESDELLPSASIEELPAKLKAFSEKFNARQEAVQKEFKQGSSEEIPPKKPEVRDLETVRKELYAAAHDGRTDDYNKLLAEKKLLEEKQNQK